QRSSYCKQWSEFYTVVCHHGPFARIIMQHFLRQKGQGHQSPFRSQDERPAASKQQHPPELQFDRGAVLNTTMVAEEGAQYPSRVLNDSPSDIAKACPKNRIVEMGIMRLHGKGRHHHADDDK